MYRYFKVMDNVLTKLHFHCIMLDCKGKGFYEGNLKLIAVTVFHLSKASTQN